MLIALYANNHPATSNKIRLVDELFYGGVPLLTATSFGTGFYLFFTPTYLVYEILRVFGSIDLLFLLNFLFKFPSIIGDLIIFYALYNIGLAFGGPTLGRRVAAVYFLNPYVIWMSSLVGHAEQLMMAFLVLSILFLIRKRILMASSSFALSCSFRHFPILILPFLLTHMWRMGKRFSKQAIRFLVVFVGVTAILSIPYLYIIIKLHQFSSTAVWAFFDHWLGEGGGAGTELTYSIAEISTFTYNFTGLVASLGIWEIMRKFFGLKAFLLTYAFFAALFLLKFKKVSIDWLNRSIVATFSLFILIIPLAQHHYMLWVFPFMLLGAYIFRNIPKHFPLTLSFSVLAVDLFASGSFVYSTDATFPYFFGLFPRRLDDWPFLDYTFAVSISLICAFILLLSIAYSLLAMLHYSTDPGNTPRKDTAVERAEIVGSSFASVQGVLLLFLTYCLLEILRGVYSYPPIYYSLVILGGFAFLFFHSSNTRSSGSASPATTPLHRVVYPIYFLTIAALSCVIGVFRLSSVTSFLPVQLLVMWFCIATRDERTVNILRLSMTFSAIYVAQVLLTSGGLLQTVLSLLFFSSWLWLQFLVEKPMVIIGMKE
ncbi:MAG: hypothetical protein ACE5GD_00930 [Candidatus Geothermarchaeales archaeon]